MTSGHGEDCGGGMSRRDFTRLAAAGIAAGGLGMTRERAAAAEASRPAGRKGDRMNVLVFVADDQAHRTIHALNNHEAHTPNLDRLVRRGVSFTHAHHQGSWHGAVCVASRAMLHTGRMLYHCGGDTCGDNPLLGEVLGERGYHSFYTGKWHNKEESLRRSFKQIGPGGGGMIDSTPFDHVRGVPLGDPAGSAYLRPAPGNTWEPDDRSLAGHWLESASDPTGYEHSSTRWADAAIAYLSQRADSPDPFFAYCAFHAPHDPRQAPTAYLDRYPTGSIELPANFLPEHPFNQGDFALRDEQLAPWPRTENAVRVHRREYYAILSHMDFELGRILDHLEATGQADNTLIVWTSDHGLAVGEHGLMGKQNMYDHSVRVPLIFAGPGVPADRRCDALVYQHSVFPTIMELAGMPIPQSVQFPSLLSQIRDPASPGPHETVFCSYRHYQRMARDERHKLILYPHTGRWQLFDLVEDPYETDDLALQHDAKSRHKDVIDRLFAALVDWQDRVGDQLKVYVGDYGLA